MSNFIICPVRGQVDLTEQAVDTFLRQSISDVKILLLDNGADETTETKDFVDTLQDSRVQYTIPPEGSRSVAGAWNLGLKKVFKEEDYCLVCNNDVLLREDTYELLLEQELGFVTAVGSKDRNSIKPQYCDGTFVVKEETISWEQKDPFGVGLPGFYYFHTRPTSKPRPHPDFSCYLIRRGVFELVGPFDEDFKNAFAEDWDYHCRLHLHGIKAVCIGVPFYHMGSATINRVNSDLADKMHKMAEANREHFRTKWGFPGASKEYSEYFNTDPAELRERPVLKDIYEGRDNG